MEVDNTDVVVKIFRKCEAGGGDRFSRQSRCKLSIGSSNPSVEQLTDSVKSQFPQLNDHQIDIVYGGRLLVSGSTLSQYGVKNGSCINIIVKEKPEVKPVLKPSDEEIAAALLKLFNPAHRSTIEKILATTDLLDRVIMSSPELQQDQLAQALMRDAGLIQVLSDSEQIQNILRKHPSLGPATVEVCEEVMKEIEKPGVVPALTDRSATYSLDQMSDDEEEAEQPVLRTVPTTAAGQGHTRQAGPPITTDLLAAALQMASGSSSPAFTAAPTTTVPQSSSAAAAPSSSTVAASSSSTSTTGINRNQLSAALSQALGNFSSPTARRTTTGSNPTRPNYDSQLQQLRDMGIHDERVALEALQAAGGDVHMALDIIYGGDIY